MPKPFEIRHDSQVIKEGPADAIPGGQYRPRERTRSPKDFSTRS